MRRPLHAAILATTMLVTVLASSACGLAAPPPTDAVPTTGAPTVAAPATAKPVQLTAPLTLPGYKIVQEGDMHLYAMWAYEALKAAAPQHTGNIRATYEDLKTKATLSVSAVAVQNGSLEQLVDAFDHVDENNNLKGTRVTLDKPSVPSEGCAEVMQPQQLFICSWIDDQTMGILTWLGTKPSDGPAQMAQIRQVIVARS